MDRAEGASLAVLRGVAWGVSLVAVGLPQVLLELAGLPIPGWLPLAGVALIGGTFIASLLWAVLRPLARYLVVLLIMQPGIHPTLWPGSIGAWQFQLPAGSPVLGGELARELSLAVLMAVALLAMGYRGRTSLLVVGRLGAAAKPVRWLIDSPISWTRLGPVSAIAIAIATLTFVVLGGGGAPAVPAAAAALPGVVVLAGLNALNEEVAFRAGPLSTLREALGERQVVFLVVALFAVPHYFGVPFGLVGVAMAGAFAWWVTKSVLETRGIFWAWVIHAVQDVVIFTFIVTGSIG